MEEYDFVIIGSGIGGLFTAALLANKGKKVCVLEKHYAVGGYGHSFKRKDYTFCAELHYIFNCMEGESGNNFFKELGLTDKINFKRLDPEGYDHLVFPDFKFKISKGESFVNNVIKEFPDHKENILKYFKTLSSIQKELYSLPLGFSYGYLIRHPLKFRYSIIYRNWTLQNYFDKFGFPLKLQSILAGQFPDIMVPPDKASLLIHAANSISYDIGACVPSKGFNHLFNMVKESVEEKNGCKVLTNVNIVKFENKENTITKAISDKGIEFSGKEFIFNADPKLLLEMINPVYLSKHFRNKLNYTYSTSSFTIYLGLKNILLKDYGFGNNNIIRYPCDSINECFNSQIEKKDMDNPYLFMTSPTQHIEEIAPKNSEQLIIVTSCDYNYFSNFKTKQEYEQEKERITNKIIEIIEKEFVPNLKEHIDVIVSGSPSTNKRFVNTISGNCYGLELSPRNIKIDKIKYDSSDFKNLSLIGAIPGIPSFGGGLHTAMQLSEILLKKH